MDPRLWQEGPSLTWANLLSLLLGAQVSRRHLWLACPHIMLFGARDLVDEFNLPGGLMSTPEGERERDP
jgi:hypothetical protein